jgi:hypothetical protein
LRSLRSQEWRARWAGFAGIFIVTNLGLLAVGATLAVLPQGPQTIPYLVGS